jgi:hypothetical protein
MGAGRQKEPVVGVGVGMGPGAEVDLAAGRRLG